MSIKVRWLLGATVLLALALGCPFFLRFRETNKRNACLNNLRQIESGSMAYCLAEKLSYGHTFTREDFREICKYMKEDPVCPVCNRPCYPVPYCVFEGPTCPCGQHLPRFDEILEPWDGDFRGYIAALQEGLRADGMRLGCDALLRLTPRMFNSVVVRNIILSGLEQWYAEPYDTDLIACAAVALGHVKDKRAAGTLVKGLTCPEWYARKRIAEALGEIGDASAVESLKPLLEDQDERVKKAAADALKKLAGGN